MQMMQRLGMAVPQRAEICALQQLPPSGSAGYSGGRGQSLAEMMLACDWPSYAAAICRERRVRSPMVDQSVLYRSH